MSVSCFQHRRKERGFFSMNHYPKAEMKGVTSSHLELLKFAFGEALSISEGNWVVIAAYTQPKQTTKQPYKMKCRNGGINKELKLTLMLLKGFYRYCRCTCTLWCTKSDGVQLVQFSMCRVWWAGRNVIQRGWRDLLLKLLLGLSDVLRIDAS